MTQLNSLKEVIIVAAMSCRVLLLMMLEIHVQLDIFRCEFMAMMSVPMGRIRRILVMMWLSVLVVVVAVKLTAFFVFTSLVMMSTVTMMSMTLVCIESVVNSMFMEVNWLDIMLIIVSMIKFVMFLNLRMVIMFHLVFIVTMVVYMVVHHFMHNSMAVVIVLFTVMMMSGAGNRETEVLLEMNWLDMFNFDMMVSVVMTCMVRSLVVMYLFM